METVFRISGFTDIYERILVPSIFAPWAGDLIERARPIGPSDRILDLGCGTGIVARRLRERLGAGARIVGVDRQTEMIEAARTLAPGIDWRVGDAMELPFADGSFELVISQQMLQFVPDRAAAVREMRRVLVPGGRAVVATWRSRAEQPLFETLGAIAERHLGPTTLDRRFALGDADELRALFTDAGFADVEVEQVSRVEHYASLSPSLAIGPMYDLAGLSPAERAARLAPIEEEGAAALKRFAVDDGIEATARANFVVAHKA